MIEQKERPKAMPFTNSMFWSSMSEQQDALDRYSGELEREAEKLAQLMCKWSETRNEELLNTFTEAAPSFVARSLDALGFETWAQVQEQLKIWSALKYGESTLPGLNAEAAEAARQAEAELLQSAECEAPPEMQATILITAVWPTVKRTLASWHRTADGAGVDTKAFAQMNVYQREHALYNRYKELGKGNPFATPVAGP